MSPSTSSSLNISNKPHVALIPSAGMGHLTPFLRLAASLLHHHHHHCRVTLVTTHPTVSDAESRFIHGFLSAFPQVTEKQLHLLPLDPATLSESDADPFFLQWEVIRRSAPLLSPLLSSVQPPLSAVISDVTLASSVSPIIAKLGLPNYILFTSSAKTCSLFRSYPDFVSSNTSSDDLEKSLIPPALMDFNGLFATMFLQNAKVVRKSNGVLINTFEALEGDTLRVLDGFPPLYAIGPFPQCDFEKRDGGGVAPQEWLDGQPEGSVVYVGFGSRTALSREQTKELGNGLVRSGSRFLWVVKGKKVDKEDEESLEKLLGDELMERIRNLGLVVKNWVDQNEILSHKAVGGFVGHGGWNSMAEAAWHGVRMLVWPQFGDQKMNAEVVERSGLGTWDKTWGWADDRTVIKRDEIGERIREMMENRSMKSQAAHIREEARKAVGSGGSSEKALLGLIQEWKK